MKVFCEKWINIEFGMLDTKIVLVDNLGIYPEFMAKTLLVKSMRKF